MKELFSFTSTDLMLILPGDTLKKVYKIKNVSKNAVFLRSPYWSITMLLKPDNEIYITNTYPDEVYATSSTGTATVEITEVIE